MKILLLNPPSPNKKKFIREGRCTQEEGVWMTLWPPISLAYIAGVLEQGHQEVKLVDCPAENITIEDLRSLLCDFCPEFVMWSVGSPSINSDLALAKVVKEVVPYAKTCVIGTHVTVLAHDCLANTSDLDFIVRNEPEFTIRELVSRIVEKEDLDTLLGISLRNGLGQIVHAPDRPFISNIDELPYPAWHLVNIDNYRVPFKKKRFLMISPTRGCPYRCSFCTCQTYYGGILRRRSIENVIGEIEYLKNNFGIDNIFFWAETFTLNRNYVSNLCEAILYHNLNISWTCNSRIDTIDGGLLKLMAKAGCWMISYGIESASQNILDACNKGITPEQVNIAVNEAKKSGLVVVGHFIFGLPGETKKSAEHTLNFAKHLNIDLAQFYCAVPFPGSSLYEVARTNGWIDGVDWEDFNQNNAIMNLPTISHEDVLYYKKKAVRDFYIRPCMVYKIVHLRALPRMREAVKVVKNFFKWHW